MVWGNGPVSFIFFQLGTQLSQNQLRSLSLMLCHLYHDAVVSGLSMLFHLSVFLHYYLTVIITIALCKVPCSSAGKESACNAEDLGVIPGLGRSPGEGNGNPVQYSCLENSMDRGAWRASICVVTKRWTQLVTNTFTLCTPCT